MPPNDLGLAAIADAGPLIHLDELDSLGLLAAFTEVLVPPTVANEASRHRPGWRQRAPAALRVVSPSEVNIRAVESQAGDSRLDPGEVAALALWLEHREATLLCDDLAARRHAEAMGCPIVGTLGILLQAARSRRLPASEAGRLIRSIPASSTLHILPELLEAALEALED